MIIWTPNYCLILELQQYVVAQAFLKHHCDRVPLGAQILHPLSKKLILHPPLGAIHKVRTPLGGGEGSANPYILFWIS